MIENRQVCDRAWPLPETALARMEYAERCEKRVGLVQSILTGQCERFFNIDAAGSFDYEQSIPVMLALGKFLRDGNKESLLRVVEDAAWDIANREFK